VGSSVVVVIWCWWDGRSWIHEQDVEFQSLVQDESGVAEGEGDGFVGSCTWCLNFFLLFFPTDGQEIWTRPPLNVLPQHGLGILVLHI
jgi:hypothetical protein